MAEVAGLVLGAVGVVGVIGAFKDTIDLFNLVGDSRHLTRDHEILATKLDIEKTLLLQWAEQVGLLSSNYDPRLDDPDTQRVVIRILKCIEVLLEDESKLTQRYGLCVAPKENGLLPKGQKISSRRWDTFVADYKRLEKNEVKRKKEKQSSSKKTRWAIRDKEKFESLVQELAHFITKIMEVVPVEKANDYIRQDVEALEDLRQLKILLEASTNFPKAIRESTKLTIVERCKDRILAKLWFRRIDDRRESIAIAHKQTLQWALKPPKKDVPWDDLSSWFRSGSGIYWVSGKAGSGKSTLMKHLYLGDHIRKLLSEWAKGEPYHLCNFFFMNLGTMEQKSQEGLSRTLLHQILSANRDLIPEVLPHMWKEMHNAAEKNTEDDIHFPSPAETKHAFEVIANSTSDVGRFCFLIDGLDEFAGSYMDGIDFLRSLAGNPRMKIMVSSRPIPDCVAAFEDVPKLNLQDLNRSDIKSYVEDIIGSHKYMKKLIQRHAEEGREIIRDVIDKSSGVFLWVVLACRKLLSGFADHDRISELRRRVDELPPELEDMFQLMLRKIDKRHQIQASRLLRLCYTFHNAPWPDASKDLYALGVALVDDYPNTTRLADELEDEDKQDLCSELEGRLRSRCGGLLELTSCGKFCLCTSPHLRHDAYIHSKVVFMHRTVFEFLSNEAVWEFECLRERADEGFNVATALSLYGVHISRQLLSSSRGTSRNAIAILWEGLRWAVSSDAQPHGDPGLFLNNLHLILRDVNVSNLDYGPIQNSIRWIYGESISVAHRGDWSHAPLAIATELGLVNFVKRHPGLPAKAS
ncbi:hypothetical protein CEP52_001060 [Fusarium oligoseptatum]|uniref:Small s protein n=1 Tax=Fusarium oligoseptatum TaxID=2604345 RepID=A0A428UL42_9HYPO|nr:hypothetical protein CEP52_001060 [Fusarium oligoseptatum]